MPLKKWNALVVQSVKISYGKIWVRIPAKVSISTEPELSIALTNFCVTIYFCLCLEISRPTSIIKYLVLNKISILSTENYPILPFVKDFFENKLPWKLNFSLQSKSCLILHLMSSRVK